MQKGPRSAGEGWFVTFEGPEGAGKTTHAQRLAMAARDAGLPVVVTREPGGTSTGERIRALLLEPDHAAVSMTPRTDALLFSAARAQLVSEVIEPALARGELVICGRFADSTLAYQGYAGGLPLDELAELERFSTGGRVPDLTILLDLPVDLGLARKDTGELTRFEAGFDLAFHRRVRDGFLALAAADPERFAVIDAARDPDPVFEDVLRAIDRLPDLAERMRAGGQSARPGGSDDQAPTPPSPSEPDRSRQRMYR